MTNEMRAKEYLRVKQAVSDILWNVDPFGIGRSIDSPRDEYDDFAGRIVSTLARSRDRDDGKARLAELIPNITNELCSELWQLVAESHLASPRDS